jgi:hypothetical protein
MAPQTSSVDPMLDQFGGIGGVSALLMLVLSLVLAVVLGAVVFTGQTFEPAPSVVLSLV